MDFFLEQQIRQLLFTLDNIVYPLIAKAYELILYLANINIIGQNDVIQGLIDRVYLLLGIFMLFKVGFSMIQYLIDPNSFSEKGKGFGKLVTNVLVCVVLLVSVPFIFKMAYQLQEIIITSNVIGSLILGEKMDDSSGGNGAVTIEEKRKNMVMMAKDVEFAMYGAFFSLNTNEKDGFPECKESPIIGSKSMAANTKCMEALWDDMGGEISRYGAQFKDYFKYLGAHDVVRDDREFKSFGKLLYWKRPSGNNFVINYTPLISAIAGGYVLLLLITFAIDIAARAFKLIFLQAVAPIAIVSYVDPKESMSNGKLHNWFSECLKTYFSLFLRLAVVFLIIQLAKLLSSIFIAVVETDGSSIYYNGVSPYGALNIWVYLMLILGVFTFAKKVPSMIEGIFGIKLSGELQLNPFKHDGFKLGLTAATVAGTTLAAGAVNTFTGLAADKGVLRSVASGIGGAVGAGRRAVMGAAHGEKNWKNFRNSFGSAMFAKQQREDYNRQGSTWYGRAEADIERHLGIMNKAQQQQLDYDREEKEMKAAKKARISDFSKYQKAASAVKSMIDNDSKVKVKTTARNNALAALAKANASGDQQKIDKANEAVEKAKRELTEAKRAAYVEIKGSGYAKQYFDDMHAARDAIARREDDLQMTLAGYEGADGTFDDKSITQVSNVISSIEYEYGKVQEALDDQKSSKEWRVNELDNSSRGVKAPQPEGWMPTGEISGEYGPNTRGGFGGGYGPGNRH